MYEITAEQETTEEDEKSLYFGSLEIAQLESKEMTEALIDIEVKHSTSTASSIITCKIDTGAEGNVLPIALYRKIAQQPSNENLCLQNSDTVIRAYGGTTIPQYGTCQLLVSHNSKSELSTFHVVKCEGPAILGLPSCRALQLVTLNCELNVLSTKEMADGDRKLREKILEDFAECFKGVGCFQGEYTITTDPDVPPVIHPPRRVPISLKEKLKEELVNLEKQGILAKVVEPTDWVNSCVCITKSNGSLRLCLDPKDLNKAIKRPHHATPTLDDVLPKLNGAKYFSILDARSGYWTIKLSTESSFLTTFNTPYGRYRFRRLPFGLVCAQDVFQRKVDETFGDLPGVTGIADDIVVVGYKEDGSDHDQNLRAVLQRAQETGLRFNPDKLRVKCTKIKFFGNVIGSHGLEPDPEKVKAIEKMDVPQNKKELQTFLGLATYLGRYTPRLSTIAAPLRDLCKQDTEFIWGPEHTKSFESLKNTLTSPAVLQYFDEKKPVTIQVDASLRGLGAALLQENGPVEYASKALTETERRYSNIEREMLAVLFGLERFHYYVYGRRVQVQTDHKPLVSIYQKNICNAPPRIARMVLRIQKYDVELVYTPGKDLQLANALSRVSPCPGREIEGLRISVHEIHQEINATPTRIAEIREATAQDPLLKHLKKIILDGWPDTRQECPENLHAFWNYRDELCVEDGMILKGARVFIPKTLQHEVMKQLHYAHQGVEKCKMRAKRSVFWAGINKDIEEAVKRCSQCQQNKPQQQKEPMLPHDIPKRPWHTLGTDLFHCKGQNYILVADYYSKFPVVKKLTSTTSSAIILQMKSIFSEFGIPSKLISDNGPQYASEEFRKFTVEYGIKHQTSSPNYPQSNGFSERMIQTVKQVITKSADPYMAMLCLRATPISSNLPSPCEMLNGRPYQTNLPSAKFHVEGETTEKLHERQCLQKKYYDQGARELPPLVKDEPVRILSEGKWEPARVISHADAPRSYNVQTPDGGVYRRNRRHLRQTSNTAEATDTPQAASADKAPPLAPSSEPTVEVARRPHREIRQPKRFEDYVTK